MEAAVFDTDAVHTRRREQALPDFSLLHEQRQNHKHVTLQLLREEYYSAHPEDGYEHSDSVTSIQRWRGAQDVLLRQECKPAKGSSTIGRVRPFLSTAVPEMT